MRRCLPLLLLLLVAGAALAQDRYATPLGIALETVPYPHEVEYLPIEVDGQTLRMAYMDVPATGGPASGRTVVLLHGKNFFGAYWRHTIAALSARGYRVVVPDQIGFGRSSKPDLDYSFDELAANTAKLLDHLRIKSAIVVGHSMGGMLAVRFARNYPSRTTHLVLENPLGLEDYRQKIPPQSDEQALAFEMKRTESDIRRDMRAYPAKWDPEIFEPYIEVLSRVRLSGEYPRWAKAAARTSQMIYREPVRHEFPLLEMPTLLLIGETDRIAPGKQRAPESVRATLGQMPDLARAAQRDLRNGTLVLLTDVGHVPHLEAPDRFVDALLAYLAK